MAQPRVPWSMGAGGLVRAHAAFPKLTPHLPPSPQTWGQRSGPCLPSCLGLLVPSQVSQEVRLLGKEQVLAELDCVGGQS